MPPHRSLLSPPQLQDSKTAEDEHDFLAALQDLIVLATDVLELSVSSLVSRPASCPEIIGKVQKVGQKWDEHDDWPGRDWYVDILMAVANLKRVLDWWEAEKGFWNFDEEDENEPLLFVMKPNREESRFEEQFKAALNDVQSSKLRALDEPLSAATVSPDVLSSQHTGRTAVGPVEGTPKARGVDDLRFLAEHAKSVNIVMELSLQGEEILYVNEAIMEVIGYASAIYAMKSD
jgi:serine/threonine-protein kinase RIM15